MTSSCVPEELIQKDAMKMITATLKAPIMKVTHAQDTVHLTAKRKNSDVPSQTIQSQDVQSLHCAFQNQKTVLVNTVIINNAHFFAKNPNNCALDLKTILDVILLTNAYQPVSKPAPSNAAMMKSNAKVKLIVILTVLTKISANLKQRMLMVMPAQMILLLMDAPSTAVEILSCAHLKKML